jgi:hypothetical protein
MRTGISLPTDNPLSMLPYSVGGESGVVVLPRQAAALALFLYQDMRWCPECGGEQLFIAMLETDFGRVGLCMGCGQEKVQKFTRTNSGLSR